MWNSKPKSKMTRVDTLVGEGTSLAGDVAFSGGLHVDGMVCGNIIAQGDDSTSLLVIGEHGCVEGGVSVPHVSISGTVTGDVRALESVELAAHAKVTGNIYYTRLEMALGAEVNGQLIRVTEEKARSLPAPEDGDITPQAARRLEKLHIVDLKS